MSQRAAASTSQRVIQKSVRPKSVNYRSSHAGQGGGMADVVLMNGTIYTVDDQQSWAEAVAIKDGRFLAVGRPEDVESLIDAHTQIVDLAGRFVMPGLYDMHTHPDLALAPGYAGYLDIGLESPTPADIRQRILDYAAAQPGDGWIYGAYFVHFTFRQAGVEPGRAWLDAILPDRPIAILDRSWGSMMVNSKALEIAQITADTPDPGNGYLERDSLTGEPTGILVDGAYAMIHAAMPPTPMPALTRAYREGVQYQSSRGVVATKYVHVCEHRLNALKALDDAGELTLRVEAAISWQDDIFPVKRRWQLIAGERHYYRSARLSANAVKFHFDGVHETRSSYLAGPWPGETSWRGGLNLTPEHITDMVVDLDRKGIRVIAHCTGDGASDLFLDAVAEARRANGEGVRHQCAHSTLLLHENLARFKALNVTAEFSPAAWYPSEFAYARTHAGAERVKTLYNFKGVLEAGGNAVMGTDWPVSNINPWIGFETMITRQSPWGEDTTPFVGEPISLQQAIEVVTINGARCMGIEARAGSIEVGKSADLIVLDRNLFEIPVRGNLHRAQVDLTVMEGQIVWDRLDQFRGSELEAVWKPEEIPDFDPKPIAQKVEP
ncbi:amidohydrolase [Aestuariicella hydrocarbonica]|uniref:Amidohydrolase n=1 Tax=Pseudomaricurvus hydrocarbonicus TaxID=1470433 RepID=A0A9E5MM89_9GAMM|nr:amidohydrolase [Aestuariicella hydrocarbonica]NHO65735.1 amidohydrolase [Aestuariicella hydrocarbonica]